MELKPNQVLVTFSSEQEARDFAIEFVDESNGLITAQPPTNCNCCFDYMPRSYSVDHIEVEKK